ncbi:MAG TPA: nitroreductase [Rhodanobacteraceae bacterium]|nr:nitroreductase [Rhodanobacteraceae bacterium]
MSAFEFLGRRLSVPARQLGEPAPRGEQLDALLQLALRVPDHGKLQPWRLLLLQGEAKLELGRRLTELHLRKDPNLAPAKAMKDRDRYRHAPLVIAVIAQLQPDHPKIPEQEQLLSAGCVGYNLLLGAQALGFAAQWLTGWAAYDADAGRIFGLDEGERIIGFVHIGTPQMDGKERERPRIADKASTWSP